MNKIVKAARRVAGDSNRRWVAQHTKDWTDFLLSQGYSKEDAKRLGTFFGAQDAYETGYGTNRGARELNNFGGMMTRNGYIKYDSKQDYMAAKLNMMDRRFSNAMKALDAESFARALGDPSRAGKGYLYYVDDTVPYDPNSPLWIAAQTRRMNNYAAGLASIAGDRYRGDVSRPLLMGRTVRNADGTYSITDLDIPTSMTYDRVAPADNTYVHKLKLAKPLMLAQIPEVVVQGNKRAESKPSMFSTQSLKNSLAEYMNYLLLKDSGFIDDDDDDFYKYMVVNKGLKLPHFEDGKDEGVEPGWHKADSSWHKNWLENRKTLLENNMRESGMESSAEEEIERQTNRLNQTWEHYPEEREDWWMVAEGITRPESYKIEYAWPDPSEQIKAHERTHAMVPTPQENASTPYVNPSDNYMSNPEEVYGNLMGLRKKLGLDPKYIVTLDDIELWRDTIRTSHLDYLSDELLVKLFNEIAYYPTQRLNVPYLA